MSALNIKSVATIAAALIASSAWAAGAAEQKCGAGTCGKKETTCKPGAQCDASCSKKTVRAARKMRPAPKRRCLFQEVKEHGHGWIGLSPRNGRLGHVAGSG